MSAYLLRRPSYYHARLPGTSARLFRAAWRQYRAWLASAIDDPTCDTDVLDWLAAILAERVNDARSSFYIYG